MALGLLYTRSMDLELALTAWASSCSTSRWHSAISRMLERMGTRHSGQMQPHLTEKPTFYPENQCGPRLGHDDQHRMTLSIIS